MVKNKTGQDGLQIEWVPIGRISGNPNNPRINEAAVDPVAASIRRFGWRQPIVAKPSGEVIAGNTRLKAARRLGHQQVPVVWFDGSDLEATAFAIADNRTHEFAEWDEPALAQLLEQLREEDALSGVGYPPEDIDDLLAQLEDPDEGSSIDDPGPQEPPDVPVTKPGNLWTLGDHRLLCGDATSQQDVARLMAQGKAALVATDPPYLVDYTGERPNDAGKDWTDRFREIDIKDPEGFFRSSFGNILEVLAPHAPIYCWHAHKRQPLLTEVWESLGIHTHQQIIWVKPTAAFGYSFWHYCHEPCLMGWRKGSMPVHDGDHEHDSVWQVDWEGKQRVVGNEHPTQKPVELFLRPMRRHTRPGDICLEPFSGSGSQLIAAEQLKRRCYAMELEPAFVDVAIRRWQSATAKEAILDGDNHTFAEIAKQRGVCLTGVQPRDSQEDA